MIMPDTHNQVSEINSMNVEPSNELTTQHTNKMNPTTIEPSTSRNAGTELSKPKVIIQTGLERYMTIVEKRKRSPQGSPTTDRAAKIVKDNENLSNYYSVLDQDTEQDVDMTNSQNEQATRQDPPRPKYKPPPIYIREPSSSKLVAELKSLIGENNFYLVDLKRGKIRETKVQVSDEVKYCQVVSWLDGKGSHYYTYQLKSAKGLRVIIKGIDSDVDPNDIISDLKTKGFDVKTAHNVLNKSKIPQPMFKIELTPESSKIPKGKIHPIYHVKYILHRKVTIDEPYKRTTMVQCQNCQEFGHTKSYCKLLNVCVACGDLHPTKDCEKKKDDPTTRKCSNCGGNHTANYRGCPVYVALNRNTNNIGNKRNLKYDLQTNITHFHQNSEHRPVEYTSYADAVRSQNHTQDNQSAKQSNQQQPPLINENFQGNIMQILLSLTTNIQQLTSTMNQMQAALNKQTEILSKLLGK